MLRSFVDDGLKALTSGVALFALPREDRFEVALVDGLWSRKGLAISAGREGERSFGYTKLYLKEEEWQPAIADWCGRVETIVFIVPSHAEMSRPKSGALWEFDYLLGSEGHLQKTIFIFPPTPLDEFASRWERVSSLLHLRGVVGWSAAPFFDVLGFQLTSTNEVTYLTSSVDNEHARPQAVLAASLLSNAR